MSLLLLCVAGSRCDGVDEMFERGRLFLKDLACRLDDVGTHLEGTSMPLRIGLKKKLVLLSPFFFDALARFPA